MTNPNAATALSLAADIRARIETGVIPYIAQDAETIARVLESLAADLTEAQAEYRRLGDASETMIRDLRALVIGLEAFRAKVWAEAGIQLDEVAA